MTVTQSDFIIQQYKEAYFALHGTHPEVRRNGSWVYLNGNITAYRVKRDLPEFTGRLKRHKIMEIQEAVHIDAGNDISPIPIKKDLIRMFFQKFFEDSGNSGFTMEKRMKDYALGGKPYMDHCEDCYDVRSLSEQLNDQDNLIQSLKAQARALKTERKHLKADIESMKENSVFFSMNDLKDVVPTPPKKKKQKKQKRKIRYSDIVSDLTLELL